MISRFRMKIDVLGQALIIIAIVLIVFLANGYTWTNITLGVLFIWQLASAAHLWLSYRYIKRMHFLQTMLVLCISLPIWIHLIGVWAYLPVAGVGVWYFIQTIFDTIKVYNRPRSFWELG